MQTRSVLIALAPALLLVATAWRSDEPLADAKEPSGEDRPYTVAPPAPPAVLFNPHARPMHGGPAPKGPSPQTADSGMPQRLAPPPADSRFEGANLGRPTHAERPEIPAEAQSLLPPGCIEAWDGPFRSAAVKRDADERSAPAAAPSEPLGEDLLGGPEDSDPLSSLGPAIDESTAADSVASEDPHRALFLEDSYPSALTCAACHPQQFEQWRVSGHAYATVSPMYQRFEQKMTELTRGTVGHFCQRCHAPVATQVQLPRYATVLDAPAVVREGITCVACHRIDESYGKTHGGRRIEPGDIYEPVAAGSDAAGVARAVADRQRLKIKSDPADTGPGQPIHREGRFFEPLTRSDFCLSCHQVAVHPGLWLEVVYSQYRSGPAAAKGVTCQQCHMGAVPGKPDGFACDSIATLAGQPHGEPRKQSNHMFWGPGYSIAHPGIFPQHEKAGRWSPREWLRFDWQAGWGTEEFERAIHAGELGRPLHAEPSSGPADCFPPPWDNADERRDARRILDENLQSLATARAGSIATMEAGSAIEGPQIAPRPRAGEPLRFRYVVRNVSEGHNLPTGSLGAQPQLWLNVALVGPDGRTMWESGYLDTLGDLADNNSLDVARGRVPRDGQLFNLQTKFLITNLKGTDREVALPVDVDFDQLPFLRPGAVPVSVLNHPPRIRMEAHSIPPLDSRTAHYRVPAELLQERGLYRLDVRLRSRVEPAYFMRFVDSTPEMINRMNFQILDIHTQSHTFYVE